MFLARTTKRQYLEAVRCISCGKVLRVGEYRYWQAQGKTAMETFKILGATRWCCQGRYTAVLGPSWDDLIHDPDPVSK